MLRTWMRHARGNAQMAAVLGHSPHGGRLSGRQLAGRGAGDWGAENWAAEDWAAGASKIAAGCDA